MLLLSNNPFLGFPTAVHTLPLVEFALDGYWAENAVSSSIYPPPPIPEDIANMTALEKFF